MTPVDTDSADTVRPAVKAPRTEAEDKAFKRELVALIPHLRAFARTLTGFRLGNPAAGDSFAAVARSSACQQS